MSGPRLRWPKGSGSRAASDLRGLDFAVKERVEAVEVCAFGRMLEDLISVCPAPVPQLEALAAACTSADVYGRPAIEEVVAALGRL
ncbi:MAG: hypothetical protein O3C45_05940 [Bacteroidetes bacterium]|nr:hypothetical protein [Bacteroidota bacterium]MDA0874589.1 hypothetical protein [Bacteroidota bacterium]